MQFQYSPYELPLLAAVIISGMVAFYSWRHRTTNGAKALALLSVALAEWACGYLLEIAGADLPTKLICSKLEYIGIVIVPVSWAVFAYEYANQGKRLTGRIIAWLGVIPLITLLLVSTTEWNGLVWQDIHISQGAGFSVLGLSHGPWFWVHIAYSYLLLAAGTGFIVRGLWLNRAQGVYRGQAAALVIAVLAPWVGNVIYLGGFSPIPLLDITPFAFTITVVAVASGIFGYGLLELSPIARDNFVDEMQEGMIVVDIQGRIADINPAALQMIGKPGQRVIGLPARVVLSAWENLLDRYQDTLEVTEEIGFGEEPDKRWYELRLSPLYSQQKRLLGRAVAIRNMTAPRKAEELKHSFLDDMKALQEIHLALSEIGELDALYVSMVQLSQERLGIDRLGLFIINEDTQELQGTYGVGQDGQPRDERYYHEPLSSLQWPSEILNAPNHAKVWENAEIYDNGATVGTGWKAGATLWNGKKAIGYVACDNFVTKKPIRPYESELISVLGSTFGHLIERKRAELLLQESEIRYRQIVETASDVIYRTDQDGCFTYINPVGMRLLGIEKEEELLGKHYTEVAAPRIRHSLKRFYDHQFLARQRNTYREFPIVAADGREVWLGQNVQLLEDNGQVLGFQAVARDITELREVQDALALARDQALEASRLKSQLLAKVSHELRTPLGGVLGYAELLHFGAFGPLDEKQQKATSQIIDSSNYLNTMVNEILDEAQIEAKSVTLHNSRFNLREMVRAVEANLSILAGKKGLALKTSVAADLPEMMTGDQPRLQQILVNLLANAIKFTAAGEVALKLYCPEAGKWAMQVADTGVGIAPEAQAYIFEPFRQANNAITRENRGTGLGLSIAKQLVELMGGTITLESEVDKGSTFTVLLPILKEAEKNS